MNTYEMIESVRDNVGETVAAHWANKMILKKLNEAYRGVAVMVLDSPGDWVMKKSVAITPDSLSRLTLPTDCVRLAYLEEVSSGRNIPIRGSVRERRGGRAPGTSLGSGIVEAYLLGNYVEVNIDSFAEPCYIWYQPRLVDLHAGVCAVTVTDATHVGLELASWPSGIDNYYNEVIIEVRDVSSYVLNVSTLITDYVGSTGVATIGSAIVTPAVGDFYGTVPQIPEELLGLVVLKATLRAFGKPSSTFEKELFGFWKSELKDAEERVESFLATRISGSTYTRVAED